MLLFMCKSLTYAQRSARLLERKGISSVIVKSPAELSETGCSYGIQLADKNAARAMEWLRSADLVPKKVYRREGQEFVRVFV